LPDAEGGCHQFCNFIFSVMDHVDPRWLRRSKRQGAT
jgi:hypothetical protein